MKSKTDKSKNSYDRELIFRSFDGNKMRYNITDIKNKPGTVIMQYIGCKDRNRKRIYEGDILDYSFYKPDADEPKTGLVVFSKDKYTTNNIWVFGFMAYWLHPDFSNLKVIGNIHENPELLDENS